MNREKLVSTATQTPPPGAQVRVLRMEDGVELRTARWPSSEGVPARGTVVLFQGRTEFIEKYYEVIGELQQKGFAVLTFDWRGQGLSSRLLTEPLKGHVDRFSDFADDARAVLDAFSGDTGLPAPFFLLAHSMGGNVALRLLQEDPQRFSKAVLCAPMTGIRTGPVPRWLTGLLAVLADLLGRGTKVAGGRKLVDPRAEAFDKNPVTLDPKRFARTIDLLQAEHALGLSAPTWRWLRQALASCRLVMRKDRAGAMKTPILLVSAALESLVDNDSHRAFAALSDQVTHKEIIGAKHEILMERDPCRKAFWDAFDTFVG